MPQTSIGATYSQYFPMVGDSKYCLCPQGLTSYTSRLYESYFAGGIPVLLSDDYVPPFADGLTPNSSIDWNSASINLPMRS